MHICIVYKCCDVYKYERQYVMTIVHGQKGPGWNNHYFIKVETLYL